MNTQLRSSLKVYQYIATVLQWCAKDWQTNGRLRHTVTYIPVWWFAFLSWWMCIFSIESATSGRPTVFVLKAFTRSAHVAFPVFSQVICICRLQSSRFECGSARIFDSFAFGILSWIPMAIHFGSVPWSASWTSARWVSTSRNLSVCILSHHHQCVLNRIWSFFTAGVVDPPQGGRSLVRGRVQDLSPRAVWLAHAQKAICIHRRQNLWQIKNHGNKRCWLYNHTA